MIPAGVVVENDRLSRASWYVREPYLVLFPLGILLAWAGVGHWLLLALGVLENFRPIFHAMAQIQAFLTCFAAGFLMTMIPRRTGTDPPRTWQLAVCVLGPIATAVFAWNERWMLAQAAWLVVAITLVGFAVSRFTSATARRRPPSSFVWIPIAFLMGIGGSFATGAFAWLGQDALWLHEFGRGLVLQGMFVALVLGVGSLVFPLMTRGEAPPDSQPSARDRGIALAHGLAGVALAASFYAEATGRLRAALAARAVLTLGVLVLGVELWRTPSKPGANRWLVWLAGWMLPAGYVLAALEPVHYKAWLHVTFIGGFAVLALAVSTQVVLGHRGHRRIFEGRPPQVFAIGLLGALAIAARVAMDLDRAHYFTWMGIAAGAFVGATVVWLSFVLPLALRPGDTVRG